jgi:hypothetical protein
MIPAADRTPHPKFAIRSTFVRRTTVEQIAAIRVTALCCAALNAIAQIRSVPLTGFSLDAAPRAKPRLISTLRTARRHWHFDCFY